MILNAGDRMKIVNTVKSGLPRATEGLIAAITKVDSEDEIYGIDIPEYSSQTDWYANRKSLTELTPLEKLL